MTLTASPKKKIIKVKVAFDEPSKSYYAWSPDIGVTGKGKTEQQALASVEQAVECYYSVKDKTHNYIVSLVS
jgi:hypothetical protein